MTLMFLLTYLLFNPSKDQFLENSLPYRKTPLGFAVTVLVSIPFTGILPDYIALLSTRIALRQMEARQKSIAWFIWMVADALCTLTIGFFSTGLAMPFYDWLKGLA